MSNDVNLDDRESDFNLNKSTESVVFRPSHSLMARPRLREQDLKPQLIFFYNNLNTDQVVYYTEQEAALMEKSTYKWILRAIGCSDGRAYGLHIRNCGVKPGELISHEKAREILQGALNAEIEVAKKNGYRRPLDQNVHFDDSFPVEQRPGFVPPR